MLVAECPETVLPLCGPRTKDPDVGRSVGSPDVVYSDTSVDGLVVLLYRIELDVSGVRVNLYTTNVSWDPPLIVLYTLSRTDSSVSQARRDY